MKTNHPFQKTLLVILFTAITAGLANAQGSTISADVRSEIEKLNQSIEKNVAKKSLSDVAAMYLDDATILAPGGKKIHGRKDIADFWYNMNNCSEFKSEITELGGNDKVVYQLGKWTLTVNKDGKVNTYSTDVVIVWKRSTSYDYKIQLSSLNNPVALQQANPFNNWAEVK
jgi:ketosteroid isomerase-like protein